MTLVGTRPPALGGPQIEPDAEHPSSEREPWFPPQDQLKFCTPAGLCVDRGIEPFIDSAFLYGLRAAYRRRLLTTLSNTPGVQDLLNTLARPELDPEVATIMRGTLVSIINLAVGLVDETIAKEHTERAKERLEIDAKTGLITQTAFDHYGPEVFDELAKEGRLVAYLFIDLDNFKIVNDTKGGHPAGDYVLRELGKIIRNVVRADDIPARYGGDEFTILLPDTALIEAVALAERLRKAVEFHEFIYEATALGVTLSIGVGTRGANDTFKTLHDRTDALLYIAKAKGKGRIAVSVPDGMDVRALPQFVGDIVGNVDLKKAN